MPAGEDQRVVDGDHQVLAEAGVEPADLGLPALGQEPQPPPVAGAREASVRYGWPLDVIDDAGHFLGVDQPEAFLRTPQRALGRP